MTSPSKRGQQTHLIHSGQDRSHFDETAEALYLTSGYVYETASEAEAAFNDEIDRFIYSRYGNPTVKALQDKMAILEGAEACLATGTGMAAIFATMACQLHAGDRVVASRALFGACHAILTKILLNGALRLSCLMGVICLLGKRRS